jgi:hypothetical protein
MPILGAIGFGLTLFVLQSMVPAIFSELETTIILALQSTQMILSSVSLIAGAAGPLP